MRHLATREAKSGNLVSRGHWKFPDVMIEEIDAQLYDGKLDGQAHLDVLTRRLSAQAQSRFDYHQSSVLLDPPVQRWLKQFAWENPPFVESEIGLKLPP